MSSNDAGLFFAGISNLLCGVSSSFLSFCVLWGINGAVQGVGWPALAAIVMAWFEVHALCCAFIFWAAIAAWQGVVLRHCIWEHIAEFVSCDHRLDSVQALFLCFLL